MIISIAPKNVDMKFKLMNFVFDNTDSFILNTFGYLWEERQWWGKFPISVYMIDNKIAGLHAFTCNTKGVDTLKTYYIVTGEEYRGQGIAKKLIRHDLAENAHICRRYYVNSEEGSDGIGLFKSMFGDNYSLLSNEFNTQDYIFESSIADILKK
jgi:GNAT superfamily N-acetyltransferase